MNYDPLRRRAQIEVSVGGRYTPFMSNYRPQCFIRTADITVALTFPEGTPDAAEKMVFRMLARPYIKLTF